MAYLQNYLTLLYLSASPCRSREYCKYRKDSKIKEYKVLTQKDKWFTSKFDPQALEQAINSYAEQGWRVVSSVTATFPGLFSSNREEMIIILERDK